MDFNVCITGAAGDGVKEAGVLLAEILSEMGYYVFIYQEYESTIRGGHNASVVRISDRKIHTHRYRYNSLICLRDYVFDYHRERLDGFVIHDSDFDIDFDQSIPVPLTKFVEEMKLPNVYRNVAALSVFCYLMGIDKELLHKKLIEKFGEKAKEEIELSEAIYKYVSGKYPVTKIPKKGGKKPVHSGSEAIALGMAKGGLEFYYAYPMSPATSILHFLAKKRMIVAIQPENEIAAIMMAIGSAFAGKRSAVGTSGGGFALMSESISLAAMAEIPVLVIEAQRSGPSTGMATFTAQEDLYFVLNPAHGEFPLIVASPLTIEDSFKLSAHLLNLAWRFQTPVILLTEKHITESYETVCFEEVGMEEIEIFNEETDEIFPRYKITDDGVSPYAVPPAIVKANGNEHDEFGITTDDAEIAKNMYSKRMRKEKAIRDEIAKRDPFVFHKWGKDVIVTWGSNYGSVIEVAQEMGLSVLGVRFLKPLVLPKIKGELFCVECNYTGLLANLIERETGREVRKILRWDGRPFTPEEIRAVID